MRLIRSVYRPANAGLSLRFQRCQDTKISSACLHPGKISNKRLLNEMLMFLRMKIVWNACSCDV